MSHLCVRCSADLEIMDPKTVGRKTTCPKCLCDVHACVFCKFYDTTKHNECGEPQADRIVDKEKSNFCDYYSLAQRSGKASGVDKQKVIADLDDLFK